MSAGAGTAKAKEPKAVPPPLTPEREAELQAQTPVERFRVLGGWSPVPHLLLDHHDKVSGHVQSILVQTVIRFTFGAQGTPEWGLIKFSSSFLCSSKKQNDRS